MQYKFWAHAHGEPVQQGHVNYCAEHGHGKHMVNGVDNGVCPRCGEVTEIVGNGFVPNITVDDTVDLHIVKAALTMYADITIARVSTAGAPVALGDLLSMVEVTDRVCALLATLNADLDARRPRVDL